MPSAVSTTTAKRRRFTTPARVLILALAYLGGGVVSMLSGMIADGPSGLSAVVWLPPGIALAALILGGVRLWPGVLAGAAVIDSQMALHESPDATFLQASLITGIVAIASTLQAVAGCRLVNLYCGPAPTLDRPKTVLSFLGLSAVTSLITSSAGSLTLFAIGFRQAADLPYDWSTWWISDTVSVFLITPVILTWVGRPERVWRPRRVLLTLPLVLTLVLVATAFSQANRLETARARADFQTRADGVSARLQHEMEEVVQSLYAFSDFEELTAQVTQDQLEGLHARLHDRHFGAGALAWVPRVTAAEREEHEREARAEGLVDYEIRESDGHGGWMPARERPAYFPLRRAVVTEAPVAWGVDLASIESRRAVLETSWRKDDVVISEPIQLLGYARDPRGVLVAVPVHDVRGNGAQPKALRGFVVCAVQIAPLLRSVLKPANGIEVSLRDVTQAAVALSLFDSTHRAVAGQRVPYQLDRQLEFGGRQWHLHAVPSHAYLHQTRSWLAAAVAVVGLAFASLLSGFLLLLTGHAASIQKLVDDRTYELMAHREHLEHLVSERTAELEVSKGVAENANLAKSVFLANMSHELRTPMHAILAFARLGVDRTEAAKPRDYFGRIVESGERLLRLLDDLLDLSKLEAGKMNMQIAPHDLRKVVHDVGAEMEPLFARKRVTLEYVQSPACSTTSADIDAIRMAQVFRNILANAVRFTQESSHVQVAFNRRSEEHASNPVLEVAISDEGPGIPEAELESIFDKFVQSSITRTKAGGTGLGLAICKQIMDLHHGSIRAYNNPERGATFVVALPLSPARKEEVAA